jgi:hypothetical protein
VIRHRDRQLFSHEVPQRCGLGASDSHIVRASIGIDKC